VFKRFSIAAVAALIFAAVMTSGLTSSAFAQAPGNNGTIKVHEQGTPNLTESNDPKVCSFNIEGFSFDAGQTGYLIFTVQGGDQPTGQAVGPYAFGPVSADGTFASQYFNLIDGHYKVTLYGKDSKGQVDYNNQLKAKSKVFKVSCDHNVVTPVQTEQLCPLTTSTTPTPPTAQSTTPVVVASKTTVKPAATIGAQSTRTSKVTLPAELPQTGATPLPAFVMLLAGLAAYGVTFVAREFPMKRFDRRA